MRIVIFRHGIAIDRDDPDCPREEDRHLTARGVDRTRLAARGLARIGLRPTRVVSSPWLRARQTAEIAMEELGMDGVRLELSDALLPFADTSGIVAEFGESDTDELLLTGHAPHLDVLLRELCGMHGMHNRGPDRLKKAGGASVRLDCRDRDAGTLEWLLPPRILRGLAQP